MEGRSNNLNVGPIALNAEMYGDITKLNDFVTDEYKNLVQQLQLPWFSELLTKLTASTGKKSFLVLKNNKYLTIPTENIAFFYIKYESAVIMCFDKQEYFVNYSLDKIQQLLSEKQFYRLNRQYLINFHAIKEVEHYFARKLLVNPLIPARDKLIVPVSYTHLTLPTILRV